MQTTSAPKIIYWQTPFGDWFKGELLAITESGIIAHRTVPYGASFVPVPFDSLNEFEAQGLRAGRVGKGI